jgi:hypothetical protein
VSAPVALGPAPTRVLLEPMRTCPATWATSSPPTNVRLTVTPLSSAGARPRDRYVMSLRNLPRVTAWVLRTAYSGGAQ